MSYKYNKNAYYHTTSLPLLQYVIIDTILNILRACTSSRLVMDARPRSPQYPLMLCILLVLCTCMGGAAGGTDDYQFNFKMPEVFGELDSGNADCCEYGGIPLPVGYAKQLPSIIGLGVHKSGKQVKCGWGWSDGHYLFWVLSVTTVIVLSLVLRNASRYSLFVVLPSLHGERAVQVVYLKFGGTSRASFAVVIC